MEKVIVSGLLIIASILAAVVTVTVLSSTAADDQASIFDSNRAGTELVGTGIDGISVVVEQPDGRLISAWFKNVGSVDVKPVRAMDVFLLSGDGLEGRYIPFQGLGDRWGVVDDADNLPDNPANWLNGNIVWGRGETIKIQLALNAATPGRYLISVSTPNGISGEIPFEYRPVLIPTLTPVPRFTLTTVDSPTGASVMTGGGNYPEGSPVTVTAPPNPGYTFNRWFGACTGTAGCTVTMDADKTVTADFLRQFTLTSIANPIAGGIVTGGGTYDAGTPVIVVATPNPGFIFVGWSGACSGVGECNVIMDTDKTATANFAPP